MQATQQFVQYKYNKPNYALLYLLNRSGVYSIYTPLQSIGNNLIGFPLGNHRFYLYGSILYYLFLRYCYGYGQKKYYGY